MMVVIIRSIILRFRLSICTSISVYLDQYVPHIPHYATAVPDISTLHISVLELVCTAHTKQYELVFKTLIIIIIYILMVVHRFILSLGS